MPGLFILFEGPDGVGKTTQLERLAAWFEAHGREVVCLREPSDGPWGRKIREAARTDTRPDDPWEEVRWFVEDRRQDVEANIRPALAAGKVVLLDRYFYSTAAYQGARGVDMARILEVNREFAPEPDAMVLMMLDADEARRRIEALRGDTPDAFEAIDYQLEVTAKFRELAHTEASRVAIVEVNAAGEIAAVQEAIRAGLAEVLPEIRALRAADSRTA